MVAGLPSGDRGAGVGDRTQPESVSDASEEEARNARSVRCNLRQKREMHVNASEMTQVGQPTHWVHRMPYGAELQKGGVRFRLWAPEAESLSVVLDGGAEPLPMERQNDGWYERTVAEAHEGTRYQFRLPDGRLVADPASRYQPEDVAGQSEVIDPAAYAWETAGWRGRTWAETVIYELHVGTFTPEGTFRAAIGKLDHLRELGVTALEIMALGDFPGRWNWGYDGVLLYAPDSTYGRPEDLKALIDEAHGHGIQVFLDVVYNHFGPEGNCLLEYAPEILTDKYETAWGQALNFECCGETRALIIHNALYWVEEFQVDGLRFDASHAMIDASPKHVLDELAERVRAAAPGREVHLILEEEHNIGKRLCRDAGGCANGFTAQWNHDLQRLIGFAVAPEWVCGEDPGGETDKLRKALAEGFVVHAQELDAEAKPDREASVHVPPTAFVAFLQSHDLVGNRIFGERIHELASAEAIRAVASLYLLLPQTPMLFMGEEWGATSRFPYFCDYKGELAKEVREGRRKQFAETMENCDAAELDKVPDPQAEETFRCAKLRWDELGEPAHEVWLGWYREALRVRREVIAPLLPRIGTDEYTYEIVGPRALVIRWQLRDGGELRLAVNLCDGGREFPEVGGRVVMQTGEGWRGGKMAAWSVVWSVAD